jgi:glycosyltransferase involved in cell wall biosynthesis
MAGKIVFINQATGYITIDIINEFVKDFDDVALITGSIRVQDTELDPSVNVKYISRYNRGNNLKKALSWLSGTIQICFLVKTRYRKHDVFYFTIPPTAYLLASRGRSLFSLMVFDLYPEALKANGFSEEGQIYKMWARQNRRKFAQAHRIYTLSENMKSQILGYSPGSDIRVIPIWSAFSDKKPVPKSENRIIKGEGLEGKFVVLYSGNIGVTHNVETLVELADILRDHTGIEFMIIGRGERSTVIRDLIAEKKLTNCRLRPFRNDDELYESLCSADLAVVILDDKTADISVPSKTYNIMAAGVPLLAIASGNSEISRIVSHYQIGRAFEKNDLKSMCEFILKMKNDVPIREMLSSNSLKAARDFTASNAVKFLEYYRDQIKTNRK